MGNLPAKRGEGYVPLMTDTSIDPESFKDKVNPLAIFGIESMTRDSQFQYITGPSFVRKYRSLLRQHHPDRGGSQLKCAIINYAFNQLREEAKHYSDPRKTHWSNKPADDFATSRKSHGTDEEMAERFREMAKEEGQEEFNKRFNETFEMMQMKDYTKDGYEVEDRTHSTARDPISVKRVSGVTSSNFNEVFNRSTSVNRSLVLREDRDPQPMESNTHLVYEIGKEKEDNYGRMVKGGTDYRIAYAGERMVDLDEAREYRRDKLDARVSMQSARAARSRQDLTPDMTAAERERWAAQKEEEERLEQERQANIAERDFRGEQRRDIFIERMLMGPRA